MYSGTERELKENVGSFSRGEQREQVGEGLALALRNRRKKRGKGTLGPIASCSVAFGDLRPGGGNKKMAGLEWVKLDLVSGWVPFADSHLLMRKNNTFCDCWEIK